MANRRCRLTNSFYAIFFLFLGAPVLGGRARCRVFSPRTEWMSQPASWSAGNASPNKQFHRFLQNLFPVAPKISQVLRRRCLLIIHLLNGSSLEPRRPSWVAPCDSAPVSLSNLSRVFIIFPCNFKVAAANTLNSSRGLFSFNRLASRATAEEA